MTTTAPSQASSQASSRAARLSVALADPSDRERTRLTALAQRALEDALDRDPRVRAHPVEFVTLVSGETIVVEVHGQSSATGHGKQGLRPERVRHLRRLQDAGFPVLLVFVEGAESRREAWLHDLPPARPVSLGDPADPDTARYGWRARELGRVRGALTLPARVTERRERAAETLL
jgi:hypothetical protein